MISNQSYIQVKQWGLAASDEHNNWQHSLAEDLKQRAHKLAKIKADAEKLAAKVNAVSLTIPVKVSATGAVYGSVTNQMLADELAKQGIEIDRKIIAAKDVKALGSFEAPVKLHRDVTATLKYEVVAEQEEA